jgi:two-component sensor histidine kinase
MSTVDFARVFEALPSPYMLLDRDLRYVAVNLAYENVVLRGRDQMIGRPLFELFPNDGPGGERLRNSFDTVLATGEPETIAYIPYDIPRPPELGGGMETRFWTAVHTPIKDAGGTTTHILQNTVDVTELARLREATTLPYNAVAATSLLERTREAEAAAADFRRLFQQAPGFFAVLSGPEHIFTFSSDAYQRLIGNRAVLGLPLREALPEVVAQGFIELLDRVYIEGVPHAAEGARVMLANEPGRPGREHFLDFSYDPIRSADGAITGIFVQGMDRTESFRAQRRQRLLIDELNHRVKNALATVQSIAAQTLRATTDTAEARKAFEARILALSKAHDMLSDRHWDDTEIGRLVQQELAAYDAGQLDLGGPVLVLNAKATVALALLFHELATNAARHGALSMPSGRLGVTWREDKDDNLIVQWTESGGPAVSVPTRKGFGTRMLNTVVTGELGGRLETRYDAGGFSALLTIPPSAYQRTAHADAQ